MSSPIEEEDVDVPLRLQPVVARPQGWRGRSSSLVAIGLVAFVVVALVLGTAFDDGPAASAPVAVASLTASPATARPSARPTVSRAPLATPLPTVEVLGGNIPSERRLVFAASGLELLDMATGKLSRPPRPIDYPALPIGGDELVCACISRIGPSPALHFERFDDTGTPVLDRELLSFEGVEDVPEMAEGYNVAIGLDPDARSLFALVVQRRPPVWTIELLVVDVETGDLLTRVEIDQVPVGFDEPEPTESTPVSPTPFGGPRDGIYLWGASVTVAPDGRHVFVQVDRSEVRNDNWTNRMLEWMVDAAPGDEASPTPLAPEATLEPGSWCQSQPVFIDDERLVQVCGGSGGASDRLHVRQIGLAGESLGHVPIPSESFDGGYPMSVSFDRARQEVFLWHLWYHALIRVDLTSGELTEARVAEAMLPGDARAPHDGRYVGAEPGLVLSPDGHRLYAIGTTTLGTTTSVSVPSGIWVFDPESMQLTDHWEARAFLTSLAVSRDGQFVYAAGASGFDVNGRQNPWPASVTVYDAATGEIQVIYGAVARDSWLGFVTPP